MKAALAADGGLSTVLSGLQSVAEVAIGPSSTLATDALHLVGRCVDMPNMVLHGASSLETQNASGTVGDVPYYAPQPRLGGDTMNDLPVASVAHGASSLESGDAAGARDVVSSLMTLFQQRAAPVNGFARDVAGRKDVLRLVHAQLTYLRATTKAKVYTRPTSAVETANRRHAVLGALGLLADVHAASGAAGTAASAGAGAGAGAGAAAGHDADVPVGLIVAFRKQLEALPPAALQDVWQAQSPGGVNALPSHSLLKRGLDTLASLANVSGESWVEGALALVAASASTAKLAPFVSLTGALLHPSRCEAAAPAAVVAGVDRLCKLMDTCKRGSGTPLWHRTFLLGLAWAHQRASCLCCCSCSPRHWH